MAIKSYNDLLAWQRGIALVEDVYRATADFPKHETYGLAGQLRRAAVSVPSNIAEGQARKSTREFTNFLSMARGSLAEVETQIIISGRLAYLTEHATSELLARAGEVGRLVTGLAKSLQRDR